MSMDCLRCALKLLVLVTGANAAAGDGACGTTDQEVVDICDVPGGVCHSFCVSNSSNSASCDFRGSYIKNMVSFHDQATAAENAGSDMSAAKIYRFAPPAFAGFPSNCSGPEFYEAVDASAGQFLGPTKHLSFELDKTCASDDSGSDCPSVLMPPELVPESANGTGKAQLMGKGFGVDLLSVRDIITYRSDSGWEQVLMYQLFAQDANLSKINFGDGAAAPKVCVQQGCAGKDVKAGQFKFTVGTVGFASQLPPNSSSVRLVFHASLENGNASEGDNVSEISSRIIFGSGGTLLALDFAQNFLYGVYDMQAADFQNPGVGKANVSIAVSGLDATVHVDLLMDGSVTSTCGDSKCMLLYDPDLSVGTSAADFPVAPTQLPASPPAGAGNGDGDGDGDGLTDGAFRCVGCPMLTLGIVLLSTGNYWYLS